MARTDIIYTRERCEWLINLGFPATRLAKLVGISPSGLEKWLHHKLSLTTARVRQIADKLIELGLYGDGSGQ